MTLIHSRTFYVNSRNRKSGNDDSFFTAEVKIPTHEKFTHVCMVAASIPKSYYLVQEGYNSFVLIEAGVSTTVYLPFGNYNIRNFCTIVTELLNAFSPHFWVYTINYPGADEAQTGKLTYSVSNNFILPGVPSQPSFVFTTNVFEQFGFNRNTTATFTNGKVVSTNVVKFQVEDVLFVHSDIIADGDTDVLQTIYVAGKSDFSSITYEAKQYEMVGKPITTSASNVFRFSLTDEDGRLLNLNGLNWNFTLLIYCVLAEHERHADTSTTKPESISA